MIEIDKAPSKCYEFWGPAVEYNYLMGCLPNDATYTVLPGRAGNSRMGSAVQGDIAAIGPSFLHAHLFVASLSVFWMYLFFARFSKNGLVVYNSDVS